MASQINPKRAAITVGTFAALAHLVWVAVVAAGAGQQLINWKLGIHFLNVPYTVTAFNAATAVVVIIAAFVVGAVAGYVLAAVWNWAGKFK